MQLSLPISDLATDARDMSSELAPVLAEELEVLHLRLAEAIGEPIDLVPTNNRSRMLSWNREESGLLRVRLQRLYARADEQTIEAVGRYIRSGDLSARKLVRAYATKVGDQLKPMRRTRIGSPLGESHDLRAYLEQQNREHFDGQFRGQIGWSRRTSGRRRRSIRLGSWNVERNLIRIHPVLDDGWVPDYVLRFVVFHELLHAIMGSQQHRGRRVFHTAAFRDREQSHPDFNRAEGWIHDHLDALLAY